MTIPCTAWLVNGVLPPWKVYACQEEPSTLVDEEYELMIGCDTGCGPCWDPNVIGALEQMGASTWGHEDSKRWLRPSPTYEARDAWGRVAPLRVGSVTLVPFAGSTYEMGTCWYNDGRECFTGTHCSCQPAPTVDPLDASSPCYQPTDVQSTQAPGLGGGLPTGAKTPELLPSCNVFLGHAWGRSFPGRFHCRTAYPFEDGPMQIHLRTEAMQLPAFVRSHVPRLSRAFVPHRACSDNLLVGALGSPGQDNTCPHVQDYGWYDKTPWARSMYEIAYIDSIACRKKIAQSMMSFALDADIAHVAAQNAALAYLDEVRMAAPGETARPFDQLDHVNREHATSGNYGAYNSEIGHYRRTWNEFDDVPPGSLPTYQTLENCRLERCGAHVVCKLKINKVSVELGVVAQGVGEYGNGVRYRAHVRVFVRMELGVTAYLPDGGPVSNYPGTVRRPSVPGGDRIVYVDADGREFTPPDMVSWSGYVGRATSPRVNFLRTYGHGATTECRNVYCDVARALSRIPVTGWPTGIEPRDMQYTHVSLGAPQINPEPQLLDEGEFRWHYNWDDAVGADACRRRMDGGPIEWPCL